MSGKEIYVVLHSDFNCELSVETPWVVVKDSIDGAMLYIEDIVKRTDGTKNLLDDFKAALKHEPRYHSHKEWSLNTDKSRFVVQAHEFTADGEPSHVRVWE